MDFGDLPLGLDAWERRLDEQKRDQTKKVVSSEARSPPNPWWLMSPSSGCTQLAVSKRSAR